MSKLIAMIRCPHGHESRFKQKNEEHQNTVKHQITCLTCGAVYAWETNTVRHLDALGEKVIGTSIFSTQPYEVGGSWRGEGIEGVLRYDDGPEP